ncbi:hypothetical protein [Chitinophaga sp.]|uniref:hypothetical protein n=1 Tax=Chitinophaga sp. TaxID=1869181 RepID=UPI0026262B14|nr:hypothetical protein [uncultured Chitinophaga sp.]
MTRPIISRQLLRPEALLLLAAALFQIRHWSLQSHGLRFRSDTADFVTTIVFDNWYSPFALTGLLMVGAFWLARKFPERGWLPAVSFITVLALPLLAYKVISTYRITYFTGNPSFFIAGTAFYKSLLNGLLMMVFGIFGIGQVIYLVRLTASYMKGVKFNA